jgi:hypothetical protein
MRRDEAHQLPLRRCLLEGSCVFMPADQNLNIDEADTVSQGVPSGGMPRVGSVTAAPGGTGSAATAAPGWEADGGLDVGEDGGEEPPHKRPKKGLSVHFAEEQPPPQQEPPPG